MSVGMDSMILVYAGFVPSKSRGRSPDFEDLRIRSKLLLHQIARKKLTIVLPTIAISELLVPVPKTQRGALAAALTEKFLCPTFDLAAAAIAADLWSQHKKLPQESQYSNRHVLNEGTTSMFPLGPLRFLVFSALLMGFSGCSKSSTQSGVGPFGPLSNSRLLAGVNG